MFKLNKIFVVIFTVTLFVAILIGSTSVAYALVVCKGPDGYFVYCVGSGDNSSGSTNTIPSTNNTNNTNTGSVAGAYSRDICVFSQVQTNNTDITDGSLIRARGGIDVYIVKYICNKKFKRLILSPHVFESYGHFDWDDVVDVDATVLTLFETSTFVRATASGDPKVYKLSPTGDTGLKRWVASETVFLDNNWDWDSIYTINTADRDAYTTGLPLN